MKNKFEEPLLTTKQVQELLSFKSSKGVEMLVKTGRLPLIDLGWRSKRYRRSDVEALLTTMTRVMTSETHEPVI